jgi:SAM-dependent methyltransferase
MGQFLFKNGYWIYRCPNCGFGQTDLAKNYTTFVKDHYSKGYFLGDPTRSAYANYQLDKPVIVRNMQKFLSHIHKIKPNGALLDVGCAYGYFVELALESGYDAYGFDASTYAANEAQKLVGKKRIQEGTIDEVTYKEKSFDVITLFDVFEHLQDPIADVTLLRRLLKDDGIIVIATGNSASVAAKVFGRRWTFYIPPQHLSFFTKANMSTFLSRIGLVPIEWFRIGKWLSLEYVLHLAKTTGESIVAAFMHHLLGGTAFSRLPLYVPMMDNMVVIVQKD